MWSLVSSTSGKRQPTLPEIDLAHLEDIIEIDDVAADELAAELEEVAT